MSDWKRIAEDLREQVADLTKERDEALRVTFDVRVIEQLAAAQATNERLREALEQVAEEKARGYHEIRSIALDVLAIPNDTAALDARLRAAKVDVLREAAEKLHDYGNPWVSDGLRHMADEIEKGERE